ncbi:MAG: FAD-binding protein, partial [Eubacterium sp.]|nr:FAD-binding protein [Eubacterium sp.]
MNQLIKELENRKIEFVENEPMSKHTTFKIGGNARLVVMPESEEEIAFIVKKCNELGVRYLTVGNGSNLLVSDKGIDACVILLGKDFDEIRLIDDTTVYASAGALLIKVCTFAL